jgi:adenosylmethionine-8-amino-7-oxononanoate aminotransferase
MSSWWAAMHGYRHPELDAAITRQLENMSHVMFGGLTHSPAVELACTLLQMANNSNDMDKEHHFTKVFFADSGSISVEVAMKMSLQYWFTLGQSRKTKFLSLRNGYHGDTLGAMSICDPVNGMHSMFSGILAKQLFVPSPCGPAREDANETLMQLEHMLQHHSEEVAAVIMEPIVQGAGGMKFYHPVVLRRARELCDEYNVLLILDEIATGFGRTGALFAAWHDEESYQPWSSLHSCSNDSIDVNAYMQTRDRSIVYPDIVCLGKALTGGYVTMGATLTTDKVAHGISSEGGPFMHGPTFMANPLACAVSLASLRLIQKSPWMQRATHVRNKLVETLSPLASLSAVAEVRVLGAIGVCELKESLTREKMAHVQRTLVDEGVWLRPFGKLLYTMPPFNCDDLEDDHLKMIGRAMYTVASEL